MSLGHNCICVFPGTLGSSLARAAARTDGPSATCSHTALAGWSGISVTATRLSGQGLVAPSCPRLCVCLCPRRCRVCARGEETEPRGPTAGVHGGAWRETGRGGDVLVNRDTAPKCHVWVPGLGPRSGTMAVKDVVGPLKKSVWLIEYTIVSVLYFLNLKVILLLCKRISSFLKKVLKYLGVKGNKVPATCFQMVQEIINLYVNIYA